MTFELTLQLSSTLVLLKVRKKRTMTDQEILVPLSDGRNTKYIEKFKQNLPTALRPYLFLLLQNRWRTYDEKSKIAPRCKYNIWVPRDGILENCTFIAVSTEPNSSDQLVWKENGIRFASNHIFIDFLVAKSIRFCIFLGRNWRRTLWMFAIIEPDQLESLTVDRIDWYDTCITVFESNRGKSFKTGRKSNNT